MFKFSYQPPSIFIFKIIFNILNLKLYFYFYFNFVKFEKNVTKYHRQEKTCYVGNLKKSELFLLLI